MHEVHVAERVPVIGLDRLHPSTRTPAEAPVPTHPCPIPVAQSRGRPQAPQPYRHGCAARTEARQGGCVVVAVRKGRGLPPPRGAAPRAASRQGEISPPTPLAPNRAPTSPCPLPTTPAPPRARPDAPRSSPSVRRTTTSSCSRSCCTHTPRCCSSGCTAARSTWSRASSSTTRGCRRWQPRMHSPRMHSALGAAPASSHPPPVPGAVGRQCQLGPHAQGRLLRRQRHLAHRSGGERRVLVELHADGRRLALGRLGARRGGARPQRRR